MSKKNRFIISSVFIALEIILGILIQFSTDTLNAVLSYYAVMIACIFPIFFIDHENYLLTQLGLIFTILADLFLVIITPMMQIPAMICFSIAQISYFLRIYFNQTSKKEKLVHLFTRLIAIGLIFIITIIVLKEKADFLSLISTFYYANLIINIIFAFMQTKSSLLFPIGLLLFACCDLQIGLNILNSSYINIENIKVLNFIANPPFNLAWLFYVPSQTLIALSLAKKPSTNLWME